MLNLNVIDSISPMVYNKLPSWLFLFLSSEVLSRIHWPINVSVQAQRHFNPGSQLPLRRMLLYWAHVQRSTVGVMWAIWRYSQETSVVA